MSMMAKAPSGYKKIGSAYLGERPVDKVFNANGDVVYALQRELTGVLPLLFKGKEQSELWNYRIYGDTETKQRDYSGSSPLTVPVHDGELYNYRIYGNTVNGESVGDRTGNLFDGYAEIGSFDLQGADVNNKDALSMCRTGYINVLPDTTYTISLNGDYVIRHVGYYGGNFTFIGSLSVSVCTFTTPSATNQIRIVFKTVSGDSANVDDFTNIPIMLNSGSTPLPYEPYGYKVPIAVTNSGITSNETIYLPEPIKMVGSEAEYVDFYSQKQYFADGTNTAITVPALPISTGTNTVTVNTTIQPSNVEVSTNENVSVGDLVTSGQHAGEYKVPVTVSNGSDTLTTPIYLPEPIKMVGEEAEYIDYAEQKMHRVRKNLLQNTATSKTINGVTFTVNGDGSVTCNGQANSLTIVYPAGGNFSLSKGTYKLTGCPINGTGNTFCQDVYSSSINLARDYGDGAEFNVTTNDIISVRLIIFSGYTCNNLTFYPMIRLASIEDDTYEPYIENTDLDVTLPALPIIKGTNTMSIDTEVQPSRMDIKGRIKSLT